MSQQEVVVSTKDRSVGLIGMGLSTRLLIDTGTQLFNPFLAIIAAGLGVNVIVMGAVVSLRSATGLVSPVFGGLAERWGYRFVMRITLLLAAIGIFIVGLSSNIWLAAIGMVIMGIGSFAFVPLLQAYLSNQLPYATRSRDLAIIEYAWAFASIIGLFIAGLLIARFGWRAPFFVLGVGLLIGWLLFARLPMAQVEPPKPIERTRSSQSWAEQVRSYLDLGANRVSAWGAIMIACTQIFAANNILIIHGEWLSREYGLGAAELGTVSLLVGGAFLTGSVLVTLIGDRFGKRRSVLWGTIACLFAYSALPFSNTSLELAVASLAVALFCFEFTLVSNIALLSEQAPTKRAKLFTFATAITLMGVTLSGLTGPWSYTQFGIWGLGALSATTMVLGLLIVLMLVKEPEQG